MTYEMLQRVSLITGIASVIMAIVSVALFFVLDIPAVIGFLTGRTRRKGIDQIRKNAQAGTLDQHTASAPQEKKGKGKKREPKAPQVQKKKQTAPAAAVAPGDNSITDRLPSRAPADAAGSEQTTVLGAPAAMTSTLAGTENLTTVLSQEYVPGTTVLSQPAPAANVEFVQQPFTIEFEIVYIHSDVVI